MSTSSERSITASLRVCICTVGVSEYSSTASHPLNRFKGLPPVWRSLYNLFSSDQRPVSMNLVEKQADCSRRRPGAGAVDHVERVTRARELHIADHRMRRGAQFLDEAASLLDGNHAVACAVDVEERRRILVYPRDRRRLAEHVGVLRELASDHYPFEEVDKACPLRRRPVLPVVATVDADHRVERRCRSPPAVRTASPGRWR